MGTPLASRVIIITYEVISSLRLLIFMASEQVDLAKKGESKLRSCEFLRRAANEASEDSLSLVRLIGSITSIEREAF